MFSYIDTIQNLSIREKRALVKSIKEMIKEHIAANREANFQRKQNSAALRAAKKAEREAAKTEKKPAHMKKVERARAKLNKLSSEAEQIFSEVVSNFGVGAIEDIAEHLMVHARAYKTQRALTQKQLPLGATVKIVGGDRRYLGMVGKVVHSQKLRTAVQIAGVRRPVYIYTGESEPAESKSSAVG